MDSQLREDPPAIHPPEVGGIYRDAGERSFMVLSTSSNGILIEYADGRTRRLEPGRGPELLPTRSLF